MFSGRPESVGDARRFAWTFAADQVPVDVADMVELVVSELCTNAVEHTASGEPGGWFILELEVHTDHVRVIVIDQGAPSGSVPALGKVPDLDATSGRGLPIVDAVSKEWGSEFVLVGRRVWADVVGEVA
ncbi:ATP-binding protein [Actinomadura viridis]|uniref:Anti-sigma regulatory factor (Ser/Thr protein kinase) n=1 Tax=Actinomadura viridis TaxID=58110 RepID=A0A931DB92_9ACTN|nr:ATP-binding protein [Actinomadura viridis]MBG6086995.1 anti-sigma regulatory factor (Ser/Thr protein kinase) [Actinomadura viridis]